MSFQPTRPRLLKLFALPLSRPSGSSAPVFYLHPKKQPPPTTSDGKPVQLPMLDRATNKAADTWNGFGKKDKGWQKKTFVSRPGLVPLLRSEERRS